MQNTLQGALLDLHNTLSSVTLDELVGDTLATQFRKKCDKELLTFIP